MLQTGVARNEDDKYGTRPDAHSHIMTTWNADDCNQPSVVNSISRCSVPPVVETPSLGVAYGSSGLYL